jgi:hypothetical protein
MRRGSLLVLLLGLSLGMLIESFALTRAGAHNPFSSLFIVDITRSMNTVDCESNGGHVSRLKFVKSALREVLRRLIGRIL